MSIPNHAVLVHKLLTLFFLSVSHAFTEEEKTQWKLQRHSWQKKCELLPEWSCIFSNTGLQRKAPTLNRTWWISGCRPLVYFLGSHRNALGDTQSLDTDHLTRQVFICFSYRLNCFSKNTKQGSYITKSNAWSTCSQQLKVCLNKWDLIDMTTSRISVHVLQNIHVPLVGIFGQAEPRKSFLCCDSLFVCLS